MQSVLMTCCEKTQRSPFHYRVCINSCSWDFHATLSPPSIPAAKVPGHLYQLLEPQSVVYSSMNEHENE